MKKPKKMKETQLQQEFRTLKRAGKILAVLIVFVIVCGLIIAFISRPNYRDLKHEFNKLNLPSDWQYEGESSERGGWGLFCQTAQIDAACPRLYVSFRSSTQYSDEQNKTKIESMMRKSGWEPHQRCNKIDTQFCYLDFFDQKDKKELRITAKNQSDGTTTYGVELNHRDYKKD